MRRRYLHLQKSYRRYGRYLNHLKRNNHRHCYRHLIQGVLLTA